MERAAFVCSHVFENRRPVLLVSRVDGDWQLLCGQAHATKETPHLVGLNHLLERDPSLQELSDLPADRFGLSFLRALPKRHGRAAY